MSRRDITIVDDTGRQATVMRSGSGWSIFCTDVPDGYRCKARVVAWAVEQLGWAREPVQCRVWELTPAGRAVLDRGAP